MKIAILYSKPEMEAPKDELDVLVQADAVAGALSSLGHVSEAVPVDLNMTELMARLREVKPDLVFNLVESLAGQDRLIHLIPAVLDYLQIPYTGAKTEAVFLTSNKLLAKDTLKANGVATPEWLTMEDNAADNTLPGKYIIKSVWDHASKGLDEHSVVAVRDRPRLLKEMELRKSSLGGECYAEAFIEGREFNLSILAGAKGPEILPPAEIRFGDHMPGKINIVGYRAKWHEDSSEYESTNRHFDFPPADEPLLQNLKTVAARCWRLFSLRGYARVDFRVDHNGAPWVLEVNVNPCLSPDAGFAAAVERAGLSFKQAIERIIEDTMRNRT
ncbi:MAG: ATP-grasp domain-containing protein [Deltaproteobacteria bacterium]|nr:ATP-grasp domain-containing protein [Deltaproteobacteria bacterium]